MLRAVIVAVAVVWPAQAAAILADEGGGLDVGTLLASYGAAAPFAALAWYVYRRAENRAEAWENRYLAQIDRQTTEVLPMLGESTRLHAETVTVLADVAQRPVPDSALLIQAERALRETIERADRGNR